MSNTSETTSFQDLCNMYELDDDQLWAISRLTGVPKSTIDAMRAGNPIGRIDTQKVLSTLSQAMGAVWTIENTGIPVLIQGLPTFKDIFDFHHIDINELCKRSNIDLTLIDQMLVNHPVDEKDAIRALHTLSNMVGQRYSLNNVAMNLASLERVAL